MIVKLGDSGYEIGRCLRKHWRPYGGRLTVKMGMVGSDGILHRVDYPEGNLDLSSGRELTEVRLTSGGSIPSLPIAECGMKPFRILPTLGWDGAGYTNQAQR